MGALVVAAIDQQPTKKARQLAAAKLNVANWRAHFFAFSPISTRRRLFKMTRRLAIADTVRFNFWATKLCPFSSRAAPEVARPPRASMVDQLGEGLASICFHLQRRGSLIECDTDPKVCAPDDATRQLQSVLRHN
jgi:hypothetical protein